MIFLLVFKHILVQLVNYSIANWAWLCWRGLAEIRTLASADAEFNLAFFIVVLVLFVFNFMFLSS